MTKANGCARTKHLQRQQLSSSIKKNLRTFPKGGRVVSVDERLVLLAQIAEANRNGARRAQATTALGLCIRTLERWAASECRSDGPKGSSKHGPHALSEEEKSEVLSRVNSAEFRDLPPSKIGPRLADKGEYLASESSIYRLLKTEKQLAHRQKSAPRVHRKPDALTATAPNQVWTWDITYLKTHVRGSYYYLYMHIEIFSRKILGWQLNECESAEYAAELFEVE